MMMKEPGWDTKEALTMILDLIEFTYYDEYETRVLTSWIMEKARSKYIK